MATRIRFVQLEAPYDTWLKDKRTRELFGKTIALKLEGYSTAYPFGILPFDASDFVATHLLICEETPEGELTPIASSKSITRARCNLHKITFPCISLLQSCGAHRHIEGVQRLLDQYKDAPHLITYESGFTVHPRVRQDPALAAEVKKMIVGFYAQYTEEMGLRQVIGFAMVKLKTDKLFATWGYRPFTIDGDELPTVRLPGYFLDEVRLLELVKYSNFAFSMARKFKMELDNRIVIADNGRFRETFKRAAY